MSGASESLESQLEHLFHQATTAIRIDGPAVGKEVRRLVGDYELRFKAEIVDHTDRIDRQMAMLKTSSEALLTQYLDRALTAERELAAQRAAQGDGS